MAHHDAEATPNQAYPSDKTSQQGSGDMTGAPDQGGSGQTGGTRVDQQPHSSGASDRSSQPGPTGWTADEMAGQETTQDPDGAASEPR